jgi:hypothetical protein
MSWVHLHTVPQLCHAGGYAVTVHTLAQVGPTRGAGPNGGLGISVNGHWYDECTDSPSPFYESVMMGLLTEGLELN